jgi:three prime repair exonuclease 1
MCNIESFVFFDIETTGLPWQERNRTKVTELSFVAVSRKDILKSNSYVPPVSKITLVFNPIKKIHPEAVKVTGLSNELLQHSSTFEKKIHTIVSFLQELPKPVCLVAHNGNVFDYKILLAEFIDARSTLPHDLLCIDSLVGFRNILKNPNTTNTEAIKPKVQESNNFNISIDDILTDDEDDWPDLNGSTEDWEKIDQISDSLSNRSIEDIVDIHLKDKKKGKSNNKTVSRTDAISKVFSKETKSKSNTGYSLIALYKKLCNKEPINSHRAEGDCLMLLECVLATKNSFIPWADTACKKLCEIQPLIRK